MTKEKLTPQRMREILTTEHGVIFFPKRKLLIPEITDFQIYMHFEWNQQEYIRGNIDEINTFLNGHAVGDRFGNDHNSRRQWRLKMYQQYGDIFKQTYYENNQFRVNNLGMMRLNIKDFGKYAAQNELKKHLFLIAQSLEDALKGSLTGNKKYNDESDLNNKLTIVHYFEDKTIAALNLIAQ